MSGNLEKLYNIDDGGKFIFETSLEAQKYAKKNPGVVIVRNSYGIGYIIKNNKSTVSSNKTHQLYLDTELLKKISDISENTLKEICMYIDIYLTNHFDKLFQVNHYISSHNIWHQFSNIKSLNKYDTKNDYIVGICPDYYLIVSKLLSKYKKSDNILIDWKKDKLEKIN